MTNDRADARVKRHGQKHMRDIYAQFIAERVSAEPKD